MCSLRLRHEQRRHGDAQRRPVGRPGAADPGDPRPLRRVRRHRDRPGARRPQEHGVPPGRHPRAARARRAGRGTRQVPPRRRPPPPRRRHQRAARRRAGGAPAVQAARRRAPARRSTSPRCRATARSTSTRSPAPRRCSRTTGSASTSRCTRPATARCCWPGCPTPSSATCSAGCRRTPSSTITTKSKLRKRARGRPRSGYAVAVDELEVGLTAIAAPVRNAHGDVVCSMSLSGPTFRLPAERVDRGGAPARRGRRRALAPARLGCAVSVDDP